MLFPCDRPKMYVLVSGWGQMGTKFLLVVSITISLHILLWFVVTPV